jgi:NADPH-dependent 2,4-dienoyl-CoA reductase/sulfur reductase-like enzyme
VLEWSWNKLMDNLALQTPSIDLIVIGAGPAGLSAAATAAELGLSVVLLDEQPNAGGQVFRGVEHSSQNLKGILGPDYAGGALLLARARSAGVKHIGQAVVWRIETDGTVVFSIDGKAQTMRATRILLATGALERAAPLPGWTLPGVMTVGAAQILLKQSSMLPKLAILAGSGPLLYLFASQMIRAGVPPVALVETQTMTELRRAIRFLPKALKDWRTLLKGLKMLSLIRSAGIPRYKSASDLEVIGSGKAQALRFYVSGNVHQIDCETVLLHQGVVPNPQINRALDLPHVWNNRQRSFIPQTDEWGAVLDTDIHIAGDGAGIVGAEASEVQGILAALDIVHRLGHLGVAVRDQRAAPLRKKLRRAIASRPFLDHAYPPTEQVLNPADSTVICRCEEVTAGEIRALTKQGDIGPNQIKSFTRCGMGPCQGRYCGLSVTQILADSLGKSADEVGYFHIRYPIKPVTLQELASLAENAD